MNESTFFYIRLAIIIVFGYLVGNISFAGMIARSKGQNIRKLGSGNPGTVNTLRNLGLKAGATVLVLDVLKGAVPALFGYFFLYYGRTELLPTVSEGAPTLLGYYIQGVSKLGLFAGGLSAIVGHIFPIFAHFKGGKGAATCIGVYLAASPLLMTAVFIIAMVYFIVFKYGSVASFICAVTMTAVEIVFALVYGDSFVNLILTGVLLLLILWAHRSNIVRLYKGQESKVTLFPKKDKPQA